MARKKINVQNIKKKEKTKNIQLKSADSFLFYYIPVFIADMIIHFYFHLYLMFIFIPKDLYIALFIYVVTFSISLISKGLYIEEKNSEMIFLNEFFVFAMKLFSFITITLLIVLNIFIYASLYKYFMINFDFLTENLMMINYLIVNFFLSFGALIFYLYIYFLRKNKENSTVTNNDNYHFTFNLITFILCLKVFFYFYALFKKFYQFYILLFFCLYILFTTMIPYVIFKKRYSMKAFNYSFLFHFSTKIIAFVFFFDLVYCLNLLCELEMMPKNAN